MKNHKNHKCYIYLYKMQQAIEFGKEIFVQDWNLHRLHTHKERYVHRGGIP